MAKRGICDSNMTRKCRVSVMHDKHILGICLSDMTCMTCIWSWQTYLRVCESVMTRIWSWQTFLGVCESDLTRTVYGRDKHFVSLTNEVYLFNFKRTSLSVLKYRDLIFLHVKRRKQNKKFLYELKLINTFAVTYSGDLFSRCDGRNVYFKMCMSDMMWKSLNFHCTWRGSGTVL